MAVIRRLRINEMIRELTHRRGSAYLWERRLLGCTWKNRPKTSDAIWCAYYMSLIYIMWTMMQLSLCYRINLSRWFAFVPADLPRPPADVVQVDFAGRLTSIHPRRSWRRGYHMCSFTDALYTRQNIIKKLFYHFYRGFYTWHFFLADWGVNSYLSFRRVILTFWKATMRKNICTISESWIRHIGSQYTILNLSKEFDWNYWVWVQTIEQ